MTTCSTAGAAPNHSHRGATFGGLPLRIALAVALVITTAVQPAQARPDEPAKDTTSSTDPTTRARSRAAFRKGVVQLRARDWAGARASFEEAWSLFPHPSILLNLGIARLRTDDPLLAEQDLVRFLSEDSGAAPEELASARDALAEARSKVGTLRVVVAPASARVVIDGKAVGVRAPAAGDGVAETRLKAGQHAVIIEADGFARDERSVDVPAKSETEVKVVLTVVKEHGKEKSSSQPTGSSARKILGWSLVGVGAGSLVASGVMGLRAISLASDYEDPTNSTSFQSPDVRNEGMAFRTGADVALVAAVLAGAGAVVLLLTDVGAHRGANVARFPPPRSGVALSRATSLRW